MQTVINSGKFKPRGKNTSCQLDESDIELHSSACVLTAQKTSSGAENTSKRKRVKNKTVSKEVKEMKLRSNTVTSTYNTRSTKVLKKRQ